ncbi:MAG: beta-ketoacyl-ACP synthase III [Gemmatales bacterium]|nr:ketoacyl-ACP synthase III [Gemmatales bacterium]MDW7994598.1 beta-ketoacyl-ACP synthase III [Gemmatales bacterium]
MNTQHDGALISVRPPCRALPGVRVIATGSYVPDGVITNEYLGQHYGCDPDWIIRRTGILERRHALPHQATSDLCYEAAEICLQRAGVSRQEVDLLICATYTPDMSFPSTACLLQDRLGLNCAAFDLQAACAGFVYALISAAAYVVAGVSRLALVVAGDTNSRVVNPRDQKTFPLFGDGAGAVLLTAAPKEYGILAYSLGSDGRGGYLLSRPACGSRLPPSPELLAQGLQYMYMDGRAVFRWAVNILCDTVRDVLQHVGLDIDDVDLFIPHQANIRIINAALDVLRIPRDKVYCNLHKYGNTSAASVPIALDEAVQEGRIREGSLVVMSGFGAGLAWGTLVMRW